MAKRLECGSRGSVVKLALALTAVLALLYCEFLHLQREPPPGSAAWVAHQSLQSNTREGGRLEANVPFVYVASELTEFVVYCVRTTSRYHPGVPIILVVSGGEELSVPALAEVLRLPHVQVKLLEHYTQPGSAAHTFARRYIHHSVVAEDFELFCFQRFFILRDIANKEGFSRCFHLDHDLVLLGAQSPFLHSSADLVALSTHSTFFSLWRLPALDRFCAHMLHFYTRPRAAVEADWARFGEALNSTFHQFSDMYMLYSFLTAAQEAGQPVSQHLLVIDQHGDLTPTHRPYYALQNLQQFIGWECTLADFQRVISWRVSPGGFLLPFANGTALQGMHFQGHFCKQIAPTVLDWLLRSMDTLHETVDTRAERGGGEGGTEGDVEGSGSSVVLGSQAGAREEEGRLPDIREIGRQSSVQEVQVRPRSAETSSEGERQSGEESLVLSVASADVVQAESREAGGAADLVTRTSDPVKETDVMAVMTGDWAVFRADEGAGHKYPWEH